MKKLAYTLFSLLLLFGNTSLKAGEGMWIPLLLGELNETEMQKMGLKLNAEDIYNINKSCLKDAIVLFGGGCTAEIVSDQGLILTNHHCGFGTIQRLSSLEHDYLTNGFWAGDRSEELPSPGLKVTLLVRMEDVTEKVLLNVSDELSESERNKIIKDNIKKIKVEAIEDTHYDALIKPFFHGNSYYLFITEVFKDIRFVGAPPSNIGKFGGDTDNWMWPRHTGDFSVFRIYADKNNNPAEYSNDNVPYKPRYSIPISLKGYDKGDFTFVFGYPGSTQSYVPSYEIQMVTEVINPIRIKLRTKRLDIIEAARNKSDLVRLQYASKSAGIANGWKKWIGENRGIKKLNAIKVKQDEEKEFVQWANSSTERKKEYGELLSSFEEAYKKQTPIMLARIYFIEAGRGIELLKFADNFGSLIEVSEDKSSTKEEIDKKVNGMEKSAASFFKNYQPEIDKKIFVQLLEAYYNDLDENYQPPYLRSIAKKYKGDFRAYADNIYKKSFFTSEQKVNDFLKNYKASSYKKIYKDPAFKLSNELHSYYFDEIVPARDAVEESLDSLQRIYMKAQMEMYPEKHFYPDANLTLRIAYGKVDDYFPRDAVHYDYFTTLEGIMEKEDPDIYDYVVEDKLKELYNKKDYGPYADADGRMHVCFTASNHTTGGNSGSPVLNGDGHLIGINFDRNWEGTMSDLMYDPSQCRNISIDIRYCLFIIDKFAGARHLVDEMTIIK